MPKPPPLFRIYHAERFDHYFPALWLLAVLLKLLAWLCVPIGLVIVFSQRPSHVPVNEVPVPLVLVTVLVSAFSGFLLWAFSDFLKLLLCLEYNTRQNEGSASGPPAD